MTYNETIARAYINMDTALKLIHVAMKTVVRQREIILKADKEAYEELRKRSVPSPETIIGGLKK